MSHPRNDTELVRRYLKDVLDGRWGLDEWLEERDEPPPVKRRQVYRWKAAVQAGGSVTLKPETRRELICQEGMDPAEVLPYPTDTEPVSSTNGSGVDRDRKGDAEGN